MAAWPLPLAGYPPHVMDGWGAQSLRWLSVFVLICYPCKSAYWMHLERALHLRLRKCHSTPMVGETTRPPGTATPTVAHAQSWASRCCDPKIVNLSALTTHTPIGHLCVVASTGLQFCGPPGDAWHSVEITFCVSNTFSLEHGMIHESLINAPVYLSESQRPKTGSSISAWSSAQQWALAARSFLRPAFLWSI